MEISDLMSEVDNYDVNVTNAEERVEALTRQANRTLSLYQELSELVRSLETRININLRQQFTDLLSLSQQLAREVSILVLIYSYMEKTKHSFIPIPFDYFIKCLLT